MTTPTSNRISPRLVVLVAIFLAFSGWSSVVVWEHGYFGFLELASASAWGSQVFVDLVIALSIAMAGLRHDARKMDLPFWPYFAVTVALGSIGPLAYLVHREWKKQGMATPAALTGAPAGAR